MSYTKHSFTTGDVIQAAPFNAMEDQIAANEQAIAGKAAAADMTALAGRVATLENTAAVQQYIVNSGETVTLPNTVHQQNAAAAWESGDSSGNSFVNLARNAANMPLTLASGYNQIAQKCLSDAVATAYNAGDTYLLIGWHVTITGEVTANCFKGETYDSSGQSVSNVTASGWYYTVSGVLTGADATTNKFTLNVSGNGTAVIDSIYCQSLTWLNTNYSSVSWSTVSPSDRLACINSFRQLFPALELVPGEDYTAVSANAGAAVAYNGSTVSYDGEDETMLVGPGAVITCTSGKLYLNVTVNSGAAYPGWAAVKWACIGDSLTDSTINATKKYHAIITEKTGIHVQMLGVGSTGYTAGAAASRAFIARCAQVDLDTDIVTLFGSVNDWKNYANNTLCPTIGTASDAYDDTKTWQENTFCANVNHTFDTLFARVPTAKVIVFGAMPYYGVDQSHFEDAREAVEAVCKARHIPYIDMYDATGFYRILTSVDYAKAYTCEGATASWTDVSDYSTSFGHPNNKAHAEIIAPIFFETLKKYLAI